MSITLVIKLKIFFKEALWKRLTATPRKRRKAL